VLVRGEGEALETYWALRGDAVGYMPGFRAFVGGKVDAADGELAMPASSISSSCWPAATSRWP
jgi:hypothetical protein